jgi:hypothetical protein
MSSRDDSCYSTDANAATLAILIREIQLAYVADWIRLNPLWVNSLVVGPSPTTYVTLNRWGVGVPVFLGDSCCVVHAMASGPEIHRKLDAGALVALSGQAGGCGGLVPASRATRRMLARAFVEVTS